MARSEEGALIITPQLALPGWELSEQFIRASGPGGQKVNKVSSGVQLRWNVERSSLPAAVKARFARLYSARLSREGDVVIEATTHRRQSLNRAEARERLAAMIRRAAVPVKRRRRTRPTAASVRRRLEAKKARAGVKALRGRVRGDD